MFLDPKKPAVILAPMEGVTDAPLRGFLTRSGYYDYCVSEFIRVSENVLSHRVFKRHVPETNRPNCMTASMVPVQVQLLGGNPERLALSALSAIEAGAIGIDLNFGCPAPTVNRHDGGATLLLYPERIEKIVRAVRDAVPAAYPVSAKLRLGFDDPSAIHENAKRAEQGGASWITIHGRTKTQGYTPPAYWAPIGEVRKHLSIPVVANGEIWTLQDFKRCREETGAIHFMIGRAALSFPNLAHEIRTELKISRRETPSPLTFPETLDARAWKEIFEQYSLEQPSEKRVKQWARYLQMKRKLPWWDVVKSSGSVAEILNRLTQFQEPLLSDG